MMASIAVALRTAALLVTSAAPPSAPPQAAWPSTVQPFFLSALNGALTTAEAAYIARFPVAVINHKQGGTAPHEEARQLAAIAAIKRANASCTTFFYLNSQIDFNPLGLHAKCAAAKPAGAWWLKQDSGTYVWENKSAGAGASSHRTSSWSVLAS